MGTIEISKITWTRVGHLRRETYLLNIIKLIFKMEVQNDVQNINKQNCPEPKEAIISS